MNLMLASNQKITLSRIEAIAHFSSTGRKRMGKVTVTLNSNSIECLRSSFIPEGHTHPVRFRSEMENGEKIRNELMIQFSNLPSSVTKVNGQKQQDRLQVKVLGDILHNLHAVGGDSVKLTVAINKATVERDSRGRSQDDSPLKQQAPLLPTPPQVVPRKRPAVPSLQFTNRLPKPTLGQQQDSLGASGNSGSQDSAIVDYKDYKVEDMPIVFKPGIAAHFIGQMAFPKNWLNHWEDEDQEVLRFKAEITVTLKVKQATNFWEKKCEDASVLNQRILDEDTLTDMSIIAQNEEVVKCHRVFLVAQSDVLKTMVASIQHMEGEEKNILFMQDLSQNGVKTMLAYICCFDLEAAEKCSEIAVELLKAGWTYLIRNLEAQATRILLKKTEDEYTINAAISLFSFASDVSRGHHEELRVKALCVIKEKDDEFQHQDVRQKLFTETPELGQKLCMALANLKI